MNMRLESLAWRLFTQPFIQAQMKENIKAPRHWPMCVEFTGGWWIPAQMASYAENVSIWWRHNAIRYLETNRISKSNMIAHIYASVNWVIIG